MNLPKLRLASEEMIYLDALRFVAAVGIVAHHSLEFFFPPAERAARGASTAGLALFVDLFFAISGFVIAHVYANKVGSTSSVLNFLRRRVARLYPLHLLTMAVSSAIWLAVVKSGFQANTAPSFAPACVIDTALLFHALVPCGNRLYLNGVNWSISAEMFMYLLFPLFVAFRRRRWVLPFAWLASLIVASLLVQQYGLWTELPPVVRALPSFLLGLCVFLNKELLAGKTRYAGYAVAALLVSLLVMMCTSAPQFYVLATVYLLFICSVGADISGMTIKLVRRVATLGQLTYSIYMLHGLIILVMMNAIGDKLLHGHGIVLIAALTYTAIAIAAYASFFWIESPARRTIDSWQWRGRRLRPVRQDGTAPR